MDVEFALFFLETLAVQTYRRGGARDVPPVYFELAGQKRDFKFALGLAEVGFVER